MNVISYNHINKKRTNIFYRIIICLKIILSGKYPNKININLIDLIRNLLKY